MEIYTIGHSNRSFDEFLRLLLKYGIRVVADVRRFPTSKFDHFKKESLEQTLPKFGIDYVWFEKLGGYRKKILDESPNIAIKSEGFRNYADYMLTVEFREEISKLLDIAKRKRLAIMCAEKFFWRCHRKFISDYLTYLGVRVLHILNDKLVVHKISKEARITDSGLVYDLMGD